MKKLGVVMYEATEMFPIGYYIEFLENYKYKCIYYAIIG